MYILSSAADKITDKVIDKVKAENTAEAAPKIRVFRAREPANAPDAGAAQVSDRAP